MKRIYLYSILLLTLTWSCGNSDQNSESTDDNSNNEVPVVAEEPLWEGLALLDGGFRLGIEIPTEKVAHGKHKVVYHEDLGELEVEVGSTFDIFILEDESQMGLIKNEIKDHAFYQVEIVVENDSSLLYRFYNESEAKEQWHMYAERNIGGATLLIRSNETRQFSEYQAKIMLESAMRITPF